MADAVERYRVGSLDGEGPTFGDEPLVAFDGGGRLHVLDASNRRTLVLDAAGDTAWTYEHPGRGPREIQYPVGLAVAGDGTQVILDQGNGKMVVLSPDGAFRRSVTLDRSSGFPSGRAAVLGSEVVSGPDPDVWGTAAPADTLTWHVRAYPVAGGPPRILSTHWRAPDPRSPQEAPELGGQRLTVRVAGLTDLRAFWPRVLTARAGDALAVVDSTAYRIQILDLQGNVTRTVGREMDPHPVTPAVESQERERRTQVIDAGDGPRFQISSSDGGVQSVDQAMVDAFVKEQIEGMAFWPEIPVIRDLAGAPDGTLWVQRSGADGTPGPIDLVRIDGRYVGTLPAGSPFPAALGPGGLVAFLDASALGVTTVRVVSWPVPPGETPDAD